MNKSEKHKLLGCPCFVLNLEMLGNFVQKAGYSVAINAEKILKYRNDKQFKLVIDNSVLPYPDGFGAVLGLRLLYGIKAEKINMPIEILKLANQKKHKVFIFGSEEWVNKKACDKITIDFPQLEIVGRNNGYDWKYESLKENLKTLSPDLVLIAFGSPKQEKLASQLIADGVESFFVGCGGALDCLAGKVERAPKFMVDNGLEWLYRLYKEPWRWKRQLVLVKFLILLFSEAIRTKFVKNP